MIRNHRLLNYIIPGAVALCPSVSHASDDNYCKPKAQKECLSKFANDSKALKSCLGAVADLKRLFCEGPSVAHGATEPKRTGSAAQAPPPPAPLLVTETQAPPPPAAPLPYPPVENADKPERQYFFIRADKLDNPYPGLSQAVTAGGALGASINYTGNDFVQATKTTKYGSYVNVSTTNSVTVSGLASVALLNPDPFYRGAWPLDFIGAVAMPSLWVSANGNSDQPTKPFGDTSALKAGIEGDVLFPDRVDLPGTNLHLFDMNYFGVAPFYQTDFYGHAQAEGATVSWTPSNHDIFVMGAPDDFKPTLVDGFLEIRAEATYLNVGQPGHTLLHQGSYEWLGAAVRSYIFFFPTRGGVDWSSVPYLADKLSFVGTYQNYWDANSHATAGMFSAALQYKLGKCDSSAQQPIEPGKKPLNCYYGAPSVSAQFDWGTDRDTLQHTKKITVKLSYAY